MDFGQTVDRLSQQLLNTVFSKFFQFVSETLTRPLDTAIQESRENAAFNAQLRQQEWRYQLRQEQQKQQQLELRDQSLVASIGSGQQLISETPHQDPFEFARYPRVAQYPRVAASSEVGTPEPPEPVNHFGGWNPFSLNPPPNQLQVASNQEVSAVPDSATADITLATELNSLLNNPKLTDLLSTTIPNQPDSNYTIKSYLEAKLKSPDDTNGWLAPITTQQAIDFLALAQKNTTLTPADLAKALQQGGVAGGMDYLNSLVDPSPAAPVSPTYTAESTPDKSVSVANASPFIPSRSTPALPPMRNASASGKFAQNVA